MLKYIDLRQYSIANKIWCWGALLLTFLLIIVILNAKQFSLLRVETAKVTNKEVSTLSAIHELEVLIYKKAILRHQINSGISADDTSGVSSTVDRQAAIRQHDDLSLQFSKAHKVLDGLMKDYAKLEMPSEKRRWKRLQAKRQKEIQAGLDNMGVAALQHNKLTHQVFEVFASPQRPEAIEAETQMLALEKTMHEELTRLSLAAYSGITSSGKTIQNIAYGAKQMSLFLMFWFSLIGLSAGYFIIRMIVSPIKNAVTFASKVADGGYSKPLEAANKDELGELAQALNKIAGVPET